MKNKIKIMIVVLLTGLISICLAQGEPLNKISNNNIIEKAQYLFIQTSQSGCIDYDHKGKFYLITLKDIDPWVTYFTMSPEKNTDFTSTENFIKAFKKNNKIHKEGLNSGFIAFEPHKETVIRYTLNLSEPEYDKKSRTVSYKAHILPGPQTSHIPHHGDYSHVALFIDACADCGGSGF